MDNACKCQILKNQLELVIQFEWFFEMGKHYLKSGAIYFDAIPVAEW